MVVASKKLSKEGLEQFKADLPPELVKTFREVLKRHHTSQRDGVRELIRWFVTQNFTLQKLIMDGVAPEYQARTAIMVLEDIRRDSEVAFFGRRAAAKTTRPE